MQRELTLLLGAIPIYKYLFLFLLVLVEGPLITMAVGWLAALGLFNPLVAYFVIVGADLVSDTLYYILGYWGREKLIKKFTLPGKEISMSRLGRIERLLKNHSKKTIVIAKLTHVAGVPVLLAAGLARVRLAIFLTYDALATFPKSLIFLLLGFYLGQASSTINQYLEYGTIVVSAAVMIVFVVYLFVGKQLEKKFINHTS